jgi:hypothetical protein
MTAPAGKEAFRPPASTRTLLGDPDLAAVIGKVAEGLAASESTGARQRWPARPRVCDDHRGERDGALCRWRLALGRGRGNDPPLLLPVARVQTHLLPSAASRRGASDGSADRPGRIWGTTVPGYWLPLDLERPRKQTLVVLDIGRRVRPAVSPDDPDRVLDLLRERMAG